MYDSILFYLLLLLLILLLLLLGRLPATTATGAPAPQVKAEDLQDVLNMIRNTSNPQVEYITRIIKKWCKDNNIKIS